MRNTYSKEFNNYIIKNCDKYTFKKLKKKLEIKFNLKITDNSFRKKLNRLKVHCTDYNKNKATGNKNIKSIGTEKLRTDGFTIIKTAEPDVWEYKQRYIY